MYGKYNFVFELLQMVSSGTLFMVRLIKQHAVQYHLFLLKGVDARRCHATGRGIQPKGVRVGDDADFKVHTQGAGDGDLNIKVTGPGNVEERIRTRKIDATTCECIYTPKKPGQYVVQVTYGGQPIAKSPFKVDVGAPKETKIRAYGPGLEKGVVGYPAKFTVETNGETGALGTLIYNYHFVFRFLI